MSYWPHYFLHTHRKKPVAKLLRTRLNNVVLPTLFRVINNVEHCYAQFSITEQYCLMLLTTTNNMRSTKLFSPVIMQAHHFWPCNYRLVSGLPDKNYIFAQCKDRTDF